MHEQSGTVYRFGPFRYDFAQRSLFKGAELIQLMPKAADTLLALLERRGQVVGKNELMKAVWPDCVVEDIGLARNISLLRKALGDDAENYIETIPKRGYRFARDVDTTSPAEEAVDQSTNIPPPPAKPSRPIWVALAAILVALLGVIYWQFYRPSKFLPGTSGAANLAVIPVEYLSSDLKPSSFSEGLTEALVEELGKTKSARVISPSTVQRYRQLRIPTALMARLLALDVVVEGSVQTFGPRVRISLRLTDVHSGKLIWADAYEMPTADLGVAETTVARSAALQVGRCLAPR